MTSARWISIAAAISQLLLALFVLAKGRKSPLKTPLSLLCLDVAGWTAATAAASTSNTSGSYALECIDHVLSPLTAPLALDFVLVFVGIRRSLHLTRTAAFILCGSVSAWWLLGVLFAHWRGTVEETWSICLLATSIPTAAFAVFTLVRHRLRTADPDERARTSLLLFVFAVGVAFGITDEMGKVAPNFPPLANIGMLICGIGMAVTTTRGRLLGGDPVRPWTPAIFVGLAAIASLCLATFFMAGTPATAAILVASAAAAAFAATAWERIVAARARGERTGELAVLGRFSAQMDHDVRNPLAALKGAAQLLQHDLSRERPAIDRLAFAGLILEQVERIEVIFTRYRRLSRLELNRSEVEINAIVQAVLSRQAPAFPETVVLRRELAGHPLPCWADADLLATIVENLARNAVEAMPEGGTLSVRTAARNGSRAGVELAVQDTGVGMDARTRELATDDFFTTKPTGSGFGLAFAKRVAEAHGGRLTIASQVGEGTLVRLWIPVRPSGPLPGGSRARD